MTSKISPVLEKLVAKYFRERRAPDKEVRVEIPAKTAPFIFEELSQRLQNHAGCFFQWQNTKGRASVQLCTAADLPILLKQVASALDSISLIFYDGSLTFSADETPEYGPVLFYLRGTNLFATDVEELAKKYNGVAY